MLQDRQAYPIQLPDVEMRDGNDPIKSWSGYHKNE